MSELLAVLCLLLAALSAAWALAIWVIRVLNDEAVVAQIKPWETKTAITLAIAFYVAAWLF